MASFARIEQDASTGEWRVANVLKVDNSVITDQAGVESEPLGKAFLGSWEGVSPDLWVQTWASGSARGKFASKGDIWDEAAGEFRSAVTLEAVDA